MIDMQEAINRVLSSTSTIDSTHVSLMDALGHTLSEDIFSDINMPPFEKATMDGYAVIGADIAGAHDCDAAAILVKTGRFQGGALTRSMPRPDLILDSVAALPAALGVGF